MKTSTSKSAKKSVSENGKMITTRETHLLDNQRMTHFNSKGETSEVSLRMEFSINRIAGEIIYQLRPLNPEIRPLKMSKVGRSSFNGFCFAWENIEEFEGFDGAAFILKFKGKTYHYHLPWKTEAEIENAIGERNEMMAKINPMLFAMSRTQVAA